MKDNTILTNHKLDIPFIFKISSVLNIENPKELNEISIL